MKKHKIETPKFSIGQKVFVLKKRSKPRKRVCDMCKKTGVVHIVETGGEMRCPKCGGYKCFTKYVDTIAVEPRIISMINITIDRSGDPCTTYQSYARHNYSEWYELGELYKTEAAAKKAAVKEMEESNE